MTFRVILALLASVLALPSGAQPRDDVILEMAQAFKQDKGARLTQLLPQAKGHALEPWAAYWELRARLGSASGAEVQEFFNRYAGTYQEDRMRNDWLILLGQRRDWTTFADEYPRFRMNDDRELRCYALFVQHLREGDNAPATLADEVRKLWFAQREADDGCTLAASRLLSEGRAHHRLTPQDVWRKARIAMEAARPRAVADAVEMVAPEAMGMLREVNAQPGKFLSSKALAGNKVRRELIGLALIRLALTDLDGAARQLDAKWSVMISPEERDWLWAVMGKLAMYKLQPEASRYFDRVENDRHLSDDLLAWKVRASLRAGRAPAWPGILQAIGAMSPEGQKEPAWTYWRARAMLATTRSDSTRAEARQLLQSIASARGFYEQLALEELGQRITLPPAPAPLTPAEREAARLNPSLNRALYAMNIGLRSEGVREWNYATNLHRPGGLPDRELLASAAFACEREVWDRCINTSERTRTEFDALQRFPTPFRDTVVKRAGEIGLDPAYVYGLIRQESRFVTDARSHVGASGLMQVMPTTARWTARKIGLTSFTPAQLSERDTNIAIGTGYLKLVLDDFEGSMPMAAAAYNAGPSRPRNWRNGPAMEGAAWAEVVPFNETRDYVKKVLANTTAYAALLTGQPQSLKARLGTVAPRDPAKPDVNGDLP